MKRREKKPNTIRLETDVPDLLRRLEVPFEKERDELVIGCVNPEHDDRKPSLRFHTGGSKNGLGYCFPCKWSGDVFTLTMLVKKMSFPFAIEFVKKSKQQRQEIESEDDEDDILFRPYYPREIDRPNVREIAPGSKCARYLAGRGVGRKEIDTFGLMDWREHRRVWIPITREKTLVSWVARAYNKQQIKALTPKGEWLGSRWGIFGHDQLDRKEKEISLTESWGSCIRVRQARFLNPVGLCGSIITEEQLEDLQWAERVIVWQEGDTAGRVMTKFIRRAFRGREIEVVELPTKKDPANFLAGKLVKLYFESRR